MNVVSEPRVIRSCLPIWTTSMSLVGLLSRSTIFPASFAACVPKVFIATATSAWACNWGVVGAVAGHSDQPPALLIFADEFELVLGRGLGARKSSTPSASAAMVAAPSLDCRR